MGEHYSEQREADEERQLKEEAGRAGMPVDQFLIFKQEPIFQFFGYTHLPDHLAHVSAHFHGMASILIRTLPRNPERTVALRKLLEAKDAAVRAAIYK